MIQERIGTLKPIRSLYRKLPYPIRTSIWRAKRQTTVFLLNSIVLQLMKERSLIPPVTLRYRVSGDTTIDPRVYVKSAETDFRLYREVCDLQPSATTLDIGCGCGMMAIPLTKYLSKDTKYEGFDVEATLIHWCKTKISPRYPNFNFQLIDVYNKDYNPKGKLKASELRFPYDDKTFDFVFARSVYTHILPEDVENYVSETARVLKDDGCCLSTFFLSNKESLKSIDRLPEWAVCSDEQFILNLYEKYGLRIQKPIHYGSWYGRQTNLNVQDIIVASA